MTTPSPLLLDVDNQAPTTPSSPRPDYFSRRHTYAASMRPLRSSPLAGPSLALSHEGVLVGPASDEDESAMSTWSAGVSSSACTSSTASTSEHGAHTRYRPSRIGSSPPRPPSTHSFSAPATLRFASPSSVHEDEPPSPTHTKSARRISLGLLKLKSMPTLPPPLPTPASRNSSSPSPRPRSILISSSTDSTPSLASISPTSTLAPAPTRRPSTAPTVTSARRRSYLAGQPPSTSRDPELNWMSATGPPPFSREGLKASGVVLPVSAREARRRSLPPLAALSMSAVAAGKMRERRQTLAPPHATARRRIPSATAGALAIPAPVAALEPPAAPFTYDSPGSSTSSLSSGSRQGSMTSLSTLSRTASAASMDSAAVVEEGCAAVVVQVNGVPVEVVGIQQSSGKGEGEGQDMNLNLNLKKGEFNSKGRGTLRRMWKRVVRSVGGR